MLYEINLDEMEDYLAYINALSVDDSDRCAELEQYLSSVNTICAGCGEFCKHLMVDEGPLYETIYRCTAPGNERIIGAESDDTEEQFEM